MKLTFLGATETVTGAKYLLEEGNTKILLDCGLFQGQKDLRLRNWQQLDVDPRNIGTLILSHAHIDHSGYIPLLVKRGFHGTIYATPATYDLCSILLPDTAYLQEEEAAYANKLRFSKHTPALPLYNVEDAKRSLQFFKTVPLKKSVRLDSKISFCFREAGHILGACMVEIKTPTMKFLYSGDLGRRKPLLHRAADRIKEADYLILESTYGDRIHETENPKDHLARVINTTYQQGGTLLIPSFAVGRSQIILYLLQQLKKERRIPHLPIYLNSPLAINATEIFLNHPKDHVLSAEESKGLTDGVRFIRTTDESKWLNSQEAPSIIISASGMAAGGRILHHLRSKLPDPRNTVLFVGYQPSGTRGDALLRGKEFIKIFGMEVAVRAKIERIDTLSAHADYTEILDWLKSFKRPPLTTFIVHGESGAAHTLAETITREMGWKCVVPKYEESFGL